MKKIKNKYFTANLTNNTNLLIDIKLKVRDSSWLIIISLILCFTSCPNPESDKSQSEYNPILSGWKPASMSPFSVNESISDFAYGKVKGNDCYVAISTGGTIAWSDNGDVWQRSVRMVTCESVREGKHCGEIFLIGLQDASYTCTVPKPKLDDDGDYIFDDNGIPILYNEYLTVTPPGVFNAVTFGDGKFVAAGNGGFFARSENGRDWIVENKDEDIVTRGLAFGNGVFVAVGSIGNKGVIRYSLDSINWIKGPPDFNPDNPGNPGDVCRLNDVAYDIDSNNFYIVGNYARWGYASYSSLSGLQWEQIESNVVSTEMRRLTVGSLTADSDVFTTLGIILDKDLGNDQWYRRPFVIQEGEIKNEWTSCDDPDCLSEFCKGRLFWKPELFKNPRYDINANININDIAFGNGYFVAVADSGVIGHLSGNLSGHKTKLYQGGDRFWNALAIPEFIETNLTAVEALNGRFFIGNNNGKIGYSK